MVKPTFIISDLIGKAFVNGGRDADTGLDCWGLVMEVFARHGIIVPDFVVDSFAFDKINTLAGESIETRWWEEVEQPRTGDAPLVVLIRMHPSLITHAGVFIGDGIIIHTMEKTGVVLSRVQTLKSRIAGYYQYVQDNQYT